ncbi:MAG: polyprenyl synthetase family protein [Clostridia bacterium]|nr:polyprenyl synthetase family protein [Clostridia bacterium]
MKGLKEYAEIVNARLRTVFPALAENSFVEGEMPELLVRSMNYSLLAGGKRLRPSMLLAAVDMLDGDVDFALDFACAVEMIHSYSLIHDDLPGMDDDTMRRGRPTNHVVFGVGQAILAGDGLLNAAFELMLRRALEKPELAQRSLRAIYEIATGAGVTGMIAGQVLDLYCEHNAVMDDHALSFIHRDKTACMFIYPLRAAGALAGATQAQIDALGRYGENFGRIFQATDDLLDVVGDAAEMGKTLGKDAEQGKLTVVSLHGVEGARAQVRMLLERAMTELDIFGAEAQFFRDLIASMVDRTK